MKRTFAALCLVAAVLLTIPAAGCGNAPPNWQVVRFPREGKVSPPVIGRMVFIRNGDVHRLDTSDGSVKRLTKVGGVTALDVRGGMVAFATGKASGKDRKTFSVQLMDLEGGGRRVVREWRPEDYQYSVISLSATPDLKKAYLSYPPPMEFAFAQTEVLNLETGALERFEGPSSGRGRADDYACLSVSPDGTRIACLHGIAQSDPDVGYDFLGAKLCVMKADGTAARDILGLGAPDYEVSNALTPPAWSADGGSLAYSSGDGEIWSVDATGGDPVKLTALEQLCTCTYPSWSPDARHVVFTTVSADNRLKLTIRAAPAAAAPVDVMPVTGGGSDWQGRCF